MCFSLLHRDVAKIGAAIVLATSARPFGVLEIGVGSRSEIGSELR